VSFFFEKLSLLRACHGRSLNVLTNVRKGFKQNIYTPGVWHFGNTWGGCWEDANVAVVGNVIGGVDYSAVIGGGGTSPSRGVGVRQGRRIPTRHAVSPAFTRAMNRLHAQHITRTGDRNAEDCTLRHALRFALGNSFKC
jgi:hypothetical protein